MCGKPWEQLSSTRHPMRCKITLNFCNGEYGAGQRTPCFIGNATVVAQDRPREYHPDLRVWRLQTHPTVTSALWTFSSPATTIPIFEYFVARIVIDKASYRYILL